MHRVIRLQSPQTLEQLTYNVTVTLQEGVQGDYRPSAGARGVPAISPFLTGRRKRHARGI